MAAYIANYLGIRHLQLCDTQNAVLAFQIFQSTTNTIFKPLPRHVIESFLGNQKYKAQINFVLYMHDM